MITIKNNIIPFKGFTALTLWPFVFVRKDEEKYYTEAVQRHEAIHGEQQKELLVLGCIIAMILCVFGCGWWSPLSIPMFLLWYGIEWLVKLCYYLNAMTAYKNISFEREAYANQHDAKYLDTRRCFAFVKYIV